MANNQGINSVSVIDGSTNTVTATIPVGSNPVGVAVRSGHRHRLRGQLRREQVSVIDGVTNTVDRHHLGGKRGRP